MSLSFDLDSAQLDFIRKAISKADLPKTEFDFEKVFWREVFTLGLLGLGKVSYDIFVHFQLLKHGDWIGAFLQVADWTKNIPFIGSSNNMIAEVLRFIIISQNQIPQELLDQIPEGEDPLDWFRKKQRSIILEKIGIPEFIDDLMTDNFGLVVLGAASYHPIKEYRRLKK